MDFNRSENKMMYFIFMITMDDYEIPSWYMAFLDANSHTHTQLENYNETFAPAARTTSFRFIIAFNS